MPTFTQTHALTNRADTTNARGVMQGPRSSRAQTQKGPHASMQA